MPTLSVQCGGCGTLLDEIAQQGETLPCPHCGSSQRCVNVSVIDEIQIKEQVGMKAKDPTRISKRKIKIEQLIGDDLHRSSGKWYKKVRVIDRDNNHYFEEVIDPESGEVIHRCEEALSDHLGHGSAKPAREGG